MPCNGGATVAVDTCALRARGGRALAPEVVVDNVVALSGGVPLAAEVGSLCKLNWGGDDCSREAGDDGEVLHDGWTGRFKDSSSLSLGMQW